MSKLRINIFSIATTSNYLWSSVVGVVKIDYLDFSCKKIDLESQDFGNCRGPEIVCFKKLFQWNLLIYIYLHCVRRLS